MDQASMGARGCFLVLGDLIILGESIKKFSKIEARGGWNEENIFRIDAECSIALVTKPMH